MTATRTIHRARLRIVIMAAFGLAAGLITLATGHPLEAPAAGWAAAAASYVAWVVSRTVKLDGAGTREHATIEDPSRPVGEVLVLTANVASMIAVAVLIISSHQNTDQVQRLVDAALGFVTVALSWMLIHTLFTLRYAELYYNGEKEGGIGFNNPDELPCYTDFAYMATSIGMTYQVSDNTIETSLIRRQALRHALLSYLFGTLVLATTINLVVSMAQ
ncbi:MULTISPECIES: DUF1345 domain-containing protein [Arthrobacter]|uniref:DUF1345 domain-containing protein n=2 Tax=Arthrobacter TaxID=1663 RepID=A0ABU9KJE6_9MICC|nr:DUF1345 domain-containing protein [Arthrobacter sp. YJM1]MDP5226844.1 DUF1345 domain-containing protein [Arthrobacter sp. YJM1]